MTTKGSHKCARCGTFTADAERLPVPGVTRLIYAWRCIDTQACMRRLTGTGRKVVYEIT